MRPKGTKNIMRSPEEKEQIILFAKANGIRETARFYSIDRKTIYTWLVKYQQNGLEGLKSKTGKNCGIGHGRPKKNLTEIDKLKIENLNLKIENERLKKGYLVKGVGTKKEYVTIKELNSK